MLQQDPLISFEPVLDSIEKSATQMAMKYLSEQVNDGTNNIVYEDILLVCKIILTPSNLLIEKMYYCLANRNRTGMPKAELASFYRKNAARIHPDKCKHPQAIEVFQKFAECYKKSLTIEKV